MYFFQILVVGSPGPHSPTFFIFVFLKKNYEYFSFSLTWDPMGAKMSKLYSSYQSQPICGWFKKPQVLKLFLNFLPNGPIFEILSFQFLTILFR